jgi:hypothetical protein
MITSRLTLTRHYVDAGLHQGNPLLVPATIVFGSVHRLGLYLAETLHAPFLPLQFLGFAADMAAAARAPGLTIVMADYGVQDRLWIWSKMAAMEHVPPAYVAAMAAAQRAVVVRSLEIEDASAYLGTYQGCFVHRSVDMFPGTRAIVDSIRDQIRPLSASAVAALRQHEWGLPDATISMLRKLWLSQGKTNDTLCVIESDTVSLFRTIPALWESYLGANSRQVEGFTLNAYWIAHPAYERRFSLVPFHFYRFRGADFDPYAATFDAIFARHQPFPTPITMRSFVNNIGNADGCSPASANACGDAQQLHDFLLQRGLWSVPRVDPYFAVGLDCTGAVCREYGTGLPLDDIPSTKARKWMEQRAPEAGLQPLDLAAVCSVCACH